MADDPNSFSLAPLMITPDMAAAARAQAAQPQPAATGPPVSSDVESLKAMFPDYDVDVIAAVLATHEGNMETAINDLLAMGPDPGTARVGGGAYSSAPPTVDSDEELALALFQQFAEDLDAPPEVRADPALYDTWVREQFARELSQEGSALAARAETMGVSIAAPDRKAGLLDRIKKMNLPGGRKGMSSVKVEGGSTPLLG